MPASKTTPTPETPESQTPTSKASKTATPKTSKTTASKTTASKPRTRAAAPKPVEKPLPTWWRAEDIPIGDLKAFQQWLIEGMVSEAPNQHRLKCAEMYGRTIGALGTIPTPTKSESVRSFAMLPLSDDPVEEEEE